MMKSSQDYYLMDAEEQSPHFRRAFGKAVLCQNYIPFENTQNSDPFYSFENQSYIMKSVKELRAGKGTAHELIEVPDE